MKTDALARRLRFAPPAPKVARIIPQEADRLLFDAIHRHGPLPSGYLYELSKHVRKDLMTLKHRLTEFYNGDKAGPFLTRPPQQFAGYEARYQHLVYDLAPRALAFIGKPHRTRNDPFLHQLMQACVGASLELLITRAGLRYIGRDEILKGKPLPLALGNGNTLIPDDLFGIEYPEGFRFFAVEIDRNTESIERKNLGYNTFGKKVENYFQALEDKRFKEWGIPNLSVLVVTTNATHALNMLGYIERQDRPRYKDRFAFQVEPCFGALWRVPKTLLAQLTEQPWQTASGTKDITKA